MIRFLDFLAPRVVFILYTALVCGVGYLIFVQGVRR